MTAKTLLVAVDGSAHAMEAVRYVEEIVALDRARIHLFHVMSPMPENLWDYTPDAWEPEEGFEAWELAERARVEAFLETAQKALMEKGALRSSISVTVKRRERGVARDIAMEAQRGYDAVVMGRRGTNPETELPIGSVANKIANTLHHYPVWIVSGPARESGILVAIDSSRGSRRALNHLASIVKRPHPDILLFHVIRQGAEGKAIGHGGVGSEKWAQRFERVEKEMKGLLEEYAGSLAQAGFERGRVRSKILTGAFSRAGALVLEARQGGYGTVVMGRRGLSETQEFVMGRVCNKVLQMGTGFSVWLVN